MIAVCVRTILMTGILITSFYIFTKITNYVINISSKIIVVIWCFLLAVLFGIDPFFMPSALFRPFACLISILIAYYITKIRLEVVISAYMISFGIGYILYYFSMFIISFFYALIINNESVVNDTIDFNQPIYMFLYSLTFILQLFLAYLFFKIRRFKKGFPFIFKKLTIIVSLIFTGLILIIATWINRTAVSEKVYAVYIYIAGIIIIGIGIYIWIRRLIKSFQRKRMQLHREDFLEKQLLEKDEEINRLTEKISAMQVIIHNYTSRLEAMEGAFNANADNYVDVKSLQNEFQAELAQIKGKKKLSSTNINAIDILFQHYDKLFEKDEISFNLIVNGSIIYMIDHFITQGKLETLILNHLKDAQIAVNASDNKFRSIMAVIGLVENCYEFTVFDSGVPFQVDTLMRLGTKRVTTYEDRGGNGIGFMTTFDIMREHNASLIITEQEISSADYSKSVSIKFDGKNQYIIKTYRSDEFEKSERYLVEELT